MTLTQARDTAERKANQTQQTFQIVDRSPGSDVEYGCRYYVQPKSDSIPLGHKVINCYYPN